MAVFRTINDSGGQALASNGLGETSLAAHLAARTTTGAPATDIRDAELHYSDALASAVDGGERYEQARASHGLARVYRAIGDEGKARHHSEQALRLYAELGVPDPSRCS